MIIMEADFVGLICIVEAEYTVSSHSSQEAEKASMLRGRLGSVGLPTCDPASVAAEPPVFGTKQGFALAV